MRCFTENCKPENTLEGYLRCQYVVGGKRAGFSRPTGKLPFTKQLEIFGIFLHQLDGHGETEYLNCRA